MNVHRLHRLDRDPAPSAFVPPSKIGDAPATARNFARGSMIEALSVRRWTVIGTMIAAMTIVTMIVLQMTPIYRASTLIMLEPHENKASDPASLAAGLTSDTARIENQILILASPSFAQRVIKKLNLDRDAEFTGGRQGAGILGLLMSFVGLRERAVSTAQLQGAVDPVILKRFAAKLTVALQGRSSAIQISFDSPDRAKAATIANAIADQYLAGQPDAPSEAPALSNDRLGELAEQVRAADRAVAQFQADRSVAGASNDNRVGDGLSGDLKGQIELARSALGEQETKFHQVNSLYHSAGGVDAVAQTLNGHAIAQLRGQQADLIRKDAELSTKYGERHPQMIELKAQRAAVDKKIDNEVQRFLQSLGAQVNASRSHLTSLEEALKATPPAVSDSENSGGAAQLRELQQRAAAARAAYQSALTGAADPRGAGRAQLADARQIDRAVVPRDPSFPNKPLILGATLLVSTLIGALFAFARERFNKGFRTSGELERVARVLNFAVVPSVAGGRGVGERVVQKPRSAYAEAMRSLQAGIQLSSSDQPPRVLLVTSSVAEEGKTSIAVSLGRLAARAGARVILVDGDLRHPSVGEQFGDRKANAGLIDVLTGKHDLATILQRDPLSPLEFLPGAAPAANAVEFISSPALKNLIDVLRLHYDLVILDAAPTLPVADTRLLSQLADKVVYVVQWEKTPREAVMSGLKMLRDAGADIAGTVLNQADMRRHALYGYGYSSGYGTHSGRYYSE